MLRSLTALAIGLTSATARPLSDEEMTALYGYEYMAGPTRKLLPPLDANETLKSAAARSGVYIGAAINYNGMTGGHGPNYPAIALSQFDLHTAENECKVGPIHPQQNSYAFTQCDYIIGASIKNGSHPRMHNYCWGAQNPSWLTGGRFTADQLRQILRDHIGNVTAHYLKDPALSYFAVDVVNEAVSDSGTAVLKNVAPWYPAVTDYIDVAFLAARAADPSHATLIYNDYGAEGFSSAKAGKVITLVKQLQAAGVPIGGVGLQMHISIDQKPTAADISANIKALGDLGLIVHITEMDVKVPNSTPARLQAQAQVYSDVLQACLDNSNCKSMEVWGVYDGDTWVGTNNHPLLWDENWNTKPAFDAVLSTFQRHAAKLEAARAKAATN